MLVLSCLATHSPDILTTAVQIFSTIGSGRRSALEQACVMGAVNVGATFVGMYVSDRFGRRKLFVVSGTFMGILEILCGALINHYFNTDNGAPPSLPPASHFVVLSTLPVVTDFCTAMYFVNHIPSALVLTWPCFVQAS